MRPSRTSPARDTCGWRRVICWGQTNWDLTAFSCGFLNCRPYWFFYALAKRLPNAYGVPILQPKVAVARPLPWDHIPRNVSTPTGLRPIRRSPIRPGRNRLAVQSLLHSLPGWASFHSADPGLEGGGGDRQTSLLRRPQNGTAILAVTATGHRLEACASFRKSGEHDDPPLKIGKFVTFAAPHGEKGWGSAPTAASPPQSPPIQQSPLRA
jgi:hypothetical protein